MFTFYILVVVGSQVTTEFFHDLISGASSSVSSRLILNDIAFFMDWFWLVTPSISTWSEHVWSLHSRQLKVPASRSSLRSPVPIGVDWCVHSHHVPWLRLHDPSLNSRWVAISFGIVRCLSNSSVLYVAPSSSCWAARSSEFRICNCWAIDVISWCVVFSRKWFA